MLKLLSMIFRRAPLLVLIVLIWILLSVLSFAGRGKAYRKYVLEDRHCPGVSIVMRGLHDKILPWHALKSGDPDTEENEGDPAGKGGAPRSSEGDEPSEKNDTEKDSSLKNGLSGLSDGEETDKDTPENDLHTEDLHTDDLQTDDSQTDDLQTGDKGTDGDQTDDKGTDGRPTDNKQESGTKGKDSVSTEAAPASAATDGKDGKEEKPEKESIQKKDESGAKALKVPAQSSSPVVKAKDYGVAQDEYLSPEETVYNTDTEGLFAPDGTFYSFQEVEDNYFADALFVGDSRTVGLFEYGGLAEAASFLARESTTVYDLFDDSEKMDYTPRGKKTTERTFRELLSGTGFRKIYLSVGVNELGVPDTKDYYKEYRRVIRKINKLQPDAIIYIQGIMHVSEDMSRTDPVYNNTAIVQRNQAIATLANGRNIFYIDMNSVLCDEDGNLKKELTGDGIHLKASACGLWHTFLRKNAIVLPEAKESKKSSGASPK